MFLFPRWCLEIFLSISRFRFFLFDVNEILLLLLLYFVIILLNISILVWALLQTVV